MTDTIREAAQAIRDRHQHLSDQYTRLNYDDAQFILDTLDAADSVQWRGDDDFVVPRLRKILDPDAV